MGTIITSANGRKRYFLCGKEVSKKRYYARQHTGKSSDREFMTNSLSGWPRNSNALGVHPAQIKDAMAADAAAGVPTEYTKKGKAIIRDNQHQRQLMKARGMRNWDGGYGHVSS